jgi:NAD(P)-binding Rossmann-like domain
MDQSYYDYIIVGGGPTGLAMAQLLMKNPAKRILLLEAESTLGGCHRTEFVNGVMTEHSPRIYSSSYKNFDAILKDMGVSFQEQFVQYNFSLTNIGSNTIWDLRLCELYALFIVFIKLMFNTHYGVDISMEMFMNDYGFSDPSKLYIDKICRVVDGTASTHFSLNEFLHIFDQQMFFPLYQPRYSMDQGFVKTWQDWLLKSEMVNITLQGKLTRINAQSNEILVNDKVTYKYGTLILALNPYIIYSIAPELFPSITPQYASRTRYMTYLTITFWWGQKLPLPKLQGFSYTDWGLAFVVVSDYYQNVSDKTMIILALTILDVPSKVLQLNANEIQDEHIIKQEAYRQLAETYWCAKYTIPPPDKAELYPGTIYKGDAPYGGWTSKNGSFINSYENASTYIPFQSPIFPNVYNVGVQNGKSDYVVTTIESAVVNAITLSKQLEPTYLSTWKLKRIMTLIYTLYIGLGIFVFLMLLLSYKSIWAIATNVYALATFAIVVVGMIIVIIVYKPYK